MGKPNFVPHRPLTDEDEEIYIHREVENEVIAYIKYMQPLLLIAPNQQGKTSFIYHISTKLKEENITLVYINLESINPELNGIEWGQVFVQRLSESLKELFSDSSFKLSDTLPDWVAVYKQIQHFCKRLNCQFVFALDEIGIKIPNPFHFFSAIKSVCNDRSERNFTFLLAGRSYPDGLTHKQSYDLFKNSLRFELPDFSEAQVCDMSRRISTEISADAIKRIFYWTSGNPCLTQLVCFNLTEKASDSNTSGQMTANDVDSVINELRIDGIDHIRFLANSINEHTQSRPLKGLFLEIISGDVLYEPGLNKHQEILRQYGVITRSENNKCIIRNQLYQAVLEAYLGNPVNDLLDNTNRSLRDKIRMYFEPHEILLLCADLFGKGVYNNLQGDTQDIKIQSLIWHCQNNNITDKLLNSLKEKRPHIDWGV